MEGHEPVGRIDHLADPQVGRGAAQQVSVGRFEPAIRPEPLDHVLGGSAGVLVEVWAVRSRDVYLRIRQSRSGPSPGLELGDIEVDVVEIDGWTFAQVARPGKPEPGFERVTVLPVYKHHRVGFVAGRTISILDMGDGWDYVPQVARASFRPDADSGNAPEMPEGWSVRDVVLEEDLLVEMPYPARVCFFDTGDSWQGPVRLDLPR